MIKPRRTTDNVTRRKNKKYSDSNRGKKSHTLSLAISLFIAGQAFAQDHTVSFDTEDPGEYKGLDLWGLDTAWLWDANVIRGVNFMGKPQVDVIRFSFTGDTPIVDGELTGSGIDEFNERMRIVDTYTGPDTVLYLNNDTENWTSNPYLDTNGVDPTAWAELIAVTTRKAEEAGRKVISVAPFNEPDYGTWQGDISRFGDVSRWLRQSGNFPEFSNSVPTGEFISIMGGNTLNNDQAANWYDTLNGLGLLEEGNTHQLAGSFDSYAQFYQTVEQNGDIGTNDELHNVMEAMVGAEYGMDNGIWWGTAERARGEFVKASDGMRLAYAEDRPNWTAASVYRAPSGKIQAFVGESERQAQPTTYRFFARDRPVFYNGYGPQRFFDVTTTGAQGYQTPNHRNAESVVNITWGEDVQPVIDGRYYLVNRGSSQVMEVAGSSTDNGAFIEQNVFDGGRNQQWDVTPIRRDIGGDNSYFEIRAVHSGKVPDV
ncbi:MAG: RICIN domain-containing protein, partial [Exilibacterium sp.]